MFCLRHFYKRYQRHQCITKLFWDIGIFKCNRHDFFFFERKNMKIWKVLNFFFGFNYHLIFFIFILIKFLILWIIIFFFWIDFYRLRWRSTTYLKSNLKFFIFFLSFRSLLSLLIQIRLIIAWFKLCSCINLRFFCFLDNFFWAWLFLIDIFGKYRRYTCDILYFYEVKSSLLMLYWRMVLLTNSKILLHCFFLPQNLHLKILYKYKI